MSDVDRPALQRAPELVAHRCHCGAYAGFGFTAPGRRQETEWWCWAHYPHKDPNSTARPGQLEKSDVEP